ncbi:MAG: hypothetical protein L7S55_06025 [Luminiphilus sp.]|nr:hypothetical protein [Luminiphilus sp.]
MKGPDKQDYEPTEAEKANAGVAVARQKRFKRLYDPLLLKMRDESLTQNFDEIARGKANADTMQALTNDLSYRNTQNTRREGDIAQALGAQIGQASQQAKAAQNQMQLGVLGTAAGQEADAGKAMSQLARIKSTEAIQRAKANQAVADAKFNAASTLAASFAFQGLDNMATKGTKEVYQADGMGPPALQDVSGTFFAPVDEDGNRISSFKDRYKYSWG